MPAPGITSWSDYSDLQRFCTAGELLPPDLMPVIRSARIVITNYHAFKLRERLPLAKGTRALITGRRGEAPSTLESRGQMMQRVMPDLMGIKNVLVINDEAHHCYREKPTDPEEETLKGGDHGSKVAAERRFRRADGPNVLVCTAAGREGINLQFSRVLFNFDLPWNPMDIEQRIGRIHRYGQQDTAQVYNLVLSDTIEGKIYLLLTDKLAEIARALGKVDAEGNITEDLRSQILGQLNDRLSYDELYRQALSDPELKRTQEELEAAIANATEARKVVFELFQDLEDFSLDDYQPLSNTQESKDRILSFLSKAVMTDGGKVQTESDDVFLLWESAEAKPIRCTLNRDLAQSDESIELMGIDHPVMNRLLSRWQDIDPSRLGVSASSSSTTRGVLTMWRIESFGGESETRTLVFPLALGADGHRLPIIEKHCEKYFTGGVGSPFLSEQQRRRFYEEHVEPSLHREIGHRGMASQERSYSAELLAWLEMDGGQLMSGDIAD